MTDPQNTGHPRVPDGDDLLTRVRAWLNRYIGVMREDDLDLLTLWAAHTWYASVTYTTPRLLLSSPVPGSGKTTVLEHLERLTCSPVQMSSVSSPALLTRMLDEKMRTILIDEADRALNPKNEGVGEIIAVINSGYKVGATRPTLVPSKEKGWVARELPTYSPVAMAGNGPQLPDDTLSRCIPVHLAPSDDVEESDWEHIGAEALSLGMELSAWAEANLNRARISPPLPPTVKGRAKERWRPLKRVAAVAGGRWPGVVDHLAEADVERIVTEAEDGVLQDRPHVVLLRHLAEIWQDGESFMYSEDILSRLTTFYPEAWGSDSPFGKALTHQRMGRMLSRNYGLQSERPYTQGRRGYLRARLEPLWSRMGIPLPENPDKPTEPSNRIPERIQKGRIDGLSGSPEGVSGTGSEPAPKHHADDDAAHVETLTPRVNTTEEIAAATGWDRQRAGRAAVVLARRRKDAA